MGFSPKAIFIISVPGITISYTVSPGFVNTQMFQHNNSEAKRAELAAKTAINRLAEPEDVARAVYFLGNPENTFISGQDLIVDGAFMAGSYQSIRR